jgi:hypothetical protein
MINSEHDVSVKCLNQVVLFYFVKKFALFHQVDKFDQKKIKILFKISVRYTIAKMQFMKNGFTFQKFPRIVPQ